MANPPSSLRILHLIRHPPPLGVAGRCYGRLDVASEDPEATAAALRPQLPPGLPLWTSPLRRCHDLARLLHPAPEVDPRLQELDFGAWEGVLWEAIPRAELDAWAADPAGFRPPGGETPRELQTRAVACVRSLPVTEAILVTHAGVIRTLHAWVHGWESPRWLDPKLAYGSWTRLEIPARAP